VKPSVIPRESQEEPDNHSAPIPESPATDAIAIPPLVSNEALATPLDRESHVASEGNLPTPVDELQSEKSGDSKGHFADFASSLLDGMCAEGDPYLGVRIPVVELRRLAELRMPSAEPGELAQYESHLMFPRHL
jgi:hypothetical protein